MAVAALALAYARRRRYAEAATILIVALPIVLWVPPNAPHWYRSLRAEYRLGPTGALAVAPPVIPAESNLPLARQALASITPDGTYAVVPHLRRARGSTAALRERARLAYLDSWFQYWLAPRIKVDPADAQWLILLDAAAKPPPAGARKVYRIGNDLLVQR
jgi:hypothetical protein